MQRNRGDEEKTARRYSEKHERFVLKSANLRTKDERF
jgi:hypothetical protein